MSNNGSFCPSELGGHGYGSACVQMDSKSALTGSENCLFLNIWTPADVKTSTSRLDVMVIVHDGGLMTGCGHEPCKSRLFTLLIVACLISFAGWFSTSPSEQRPQTGPFAIPRIYP